MLLSVPASEAMAQVVFADSFEESCSLDDDNDRLVNCQEAIHGTSTTNPDTDGDGLSDGDEVLGTLGGLNLPALGAKPRRKDILIEHDWSDDATECAAHSHRPPPDALEQLRMAFANAPVSNPNGQTGVNLISDSGQGGLLSGGSFIAIPDGIIQGGIFGPDFPIYKAANLASNRVGYFHYVIHAHRYTEWPYSSGQAEIIGDDMIVSVQCTLLSWVIRNTVMHELGHNIGLRHGGNTSCNYKRNYNSVMNYSFTFPGIDTNCDGSGDGVLDYSVGSRITINENSINESQGVCGSTPIDWNGDGSIQNGIQYDINAEDNSGCGGIYTTLSDFNDWANLILSSLPGGPGAGQTIGVIVCQDTPSLP